jgi:hypothetical protein
MISYFEEFKAVSFPRDRKFPIMTKYSEGADNIDGDKASNSANKQNPKSINMKLVDLVKLMHGSFESKQKLIDDFN